MLRLEMLAGLAGFQGSEGTLRQMIAAAVELVIQISRLSNGQRRVVSVTEVTGVRDNQFVLNELYSFDLDTSHFVAVNVVPCNPKLRDLVANTKWL